MTFDFSTLGDPALRLGLALLLGSAIGIERQWHQKMAGLRTNALVALGASGFIVLSNLVGQGDPTRIAAQVVTGIGFLGAGIILREGVNVHGLNTAATLWCSAMVGTLAGAGFGAPSILAAAFVIGTNLVLRPVVRAMNDRLLSRASGETFYSVDVSCPAAEEARLRALLLQEISGAGLVLRRLESNDLPETTPGATKVRVKAKAVATRRQDATLEQIVGRLSLDPVVSGTSWRIDEENPEA